MASTLQPSDDIQTKEAAEWALTTKTPVAIVGKKSKSQLGRPTNLDVTLDLSRLTGVKNYEPSELVLTARPGTSLKDLKVHLDEYRQELAFEPPDYGPIFGQESDKGTLGGVIACNLSGPRRIKAGAARDHFLGMEGINGRAEFFKAGGKVVKNVTGYDVCKLIAGSYGTLALLTEITVKVLPKSEKIRTVLIAGLTEEKALSVFRELGSGTVEPSGLAYLPADVAKCSNVDMVSNSDCSITAVRLEGPTPSVLKRCEDVTDSFAGYGEIEELHGSRSAIFWKEIADLSLFEESPISTIWRVVVPPSKASLFTDNLPKEFQLSWYLDWAGGLIWVETKEEPDQLHSSIRAIGAALGGQTTLFRGNSTFRASVEVFEPLPKAIFQLNYRVKQAFDPNTIFNPSRVYAGI